MQIKWTKDISVGDATIDQQHQRLLAQINKLAQALKKDEEQSVIEDIIQFFNVYIVDHFQYEEKYMDMHHYPHLEQHKKIHGVFKEKYKKFKQGLGTEDYGVLAKEVEDFLGKWWLRHIGEVDGEYYEYILDNPRSHPANETEDYHTKVQPY